MKTCLLLLLSCLCLLSIESKAQWVRTAPNVVLQTSTDNVGIGITPTQKLHVLGNTLVTGNLIFGTTGSTGLLHLNSTTNNFNLRLNATNRFTILNTSGFVGIGDNF